MTDTGPAPGWYADPGGTSRWRWWSGVAWTQHTSAVGSSRADLGGLLDKEQRIVRLALWAMVAYCGCALFSLAAADSLAAMLLRDWHWFQSLRHQLSISGNGTAPPFPALPQGTGIESWASLVSPIQLAATVVLLIWQHRAAKVALALGYPAKRSPGWGVACWLVPVVQLWMPYGAVRDLLPPEHQARRIVRLWWCALLGLFVLQSALILLLVFAHGAGLALYPFALFTPFALGWFGCGVVRSVAVEHKAAAAALLRAPRAPSW